MVGADIVSSYLPVECEIALDQAHLDSLIAAFFNMGTITLVVDTFHP
jgi:hypothetical protein